MGQGKSPQPGCLKNKQLLVLTLWGMKGAGNKWL